MSDHIYCSENLPKPKRTHKRWKTIPKPCPFCGELKVRQHIAWCYKNPKKIPGSDLHRKMVAALVEKNSKKYAIHYEYKNCKKCRKEFKFNPRSKQQRTNCSRSCAPPQPIKNPKKVHPARKQKTKTIKLQIIYGNCKECHKCLYRSGQIFCSRLCANNIHKKNQQTVLTFRHHCEFRFNLKNFPLEFNFSLLSQFGMFSPKTNPMGASRDHKVSIQYGFENKIDPWFISHPANCQLITQADNTKKQGKCSITIDQLKMDIQSWEAKYPSQNFQI